MRGTCEESYRIPICPVWLSIKQDLSKSSDDPAKLWGQEDPIQQGRQLDNGDLAKRLENSFVPLLQSCRAHANWQRPGPERSATRQE